VNVVSGVPCDGCGHDGRADIVDRASEGPVPLGLMLRCSLCGDLYPWMLDLPATLERTFDE
jgi:uncharacterized Zn finger protein